jgi:transposase-like protein
MKKQEAEFDPEELNLIALARDYDAPDKARALLESLRWPNGPVCPHCKNDGQQKAIYKLMPKPTSTRPARPGVCKCGACRRQFTVTVGTIFEDSHIAISTWLKAVFILCSSKKAISAHQMHRMLGITYKTAWFMCHRIRYAMMPMIGPDKLKGIVEVDETFIGGKAPQKRSYKNKTPVIALIERGGDCHTRVVPTVTQKNLKLALAECVDKSAVINTDTSGASHGTVKTYAGHHQVNHTAKQYARVLPDGTVAHVNTCESFFSLLKRGVVGAWHHISPEHLPKYSGEFAFRWNHRKITDGERTVAAIKATEGKRLTYKQVI